MDNSYDCSNRYRFFSVKAKTNSDFKAGKTTNSGSRDNDDLKFTTVKETNKKKKGIKTFTYSVFLVS